MFLTALFFTALAREVVDARTSRLTDRRSAPASSASLRVIVAVRIGAPFGGFRIAFRPGFIDSFKRFVALEAAVARVVTFVVQLPPDRRSRLFSGETAWPEELVAQLGDRQGYIDAAGYRNTDGGTDLVFRGSFPFLWWPLGEWVVFKGVHFRADNHTEPFSSDELRQVW